MKFKKAYRKFIEGKRVKSLYSGFRYQDGFKYDIWGTKYEFNGFTREEKENDWVRME